KCEKPGCIINLGNQALGESLPVAGTSYSLNYYSDRVEGRQAERTVHVPIIGSQINTLDLDKIIVRMQILGRRFETQYNPAINLSHTFTWDGKDVFGRYVSGTHNAVVAISYQYDNSTYVPVPPTGTYSFGQPPSTVTGGPASRKPSIQTFEFNQDVTVPPLSSKEAIGGWSLNVHHKLDELGNNFYAGNDFVRENVSTKKIVRALANGFTNIRDLQVAPSGGTYIAEAAHIVRLNADGSRTVIAGDGATNFFNSSGPALSASLSIASFVVKSDNLFYISDTRGYIWRYENGQIYHQAGNPAGSDLFLIDAKTARFVTPGHIRLSPEGEIYFVDRGRRRIFKIDADNKLIHVAGTGLAGTTLEGAQAVTSNMDPRVIAIGEQGRIYVSTAISGLRSIIWTIDSAGALERLIGGGNNDPVDGSLGTDIQIEEITSLVLSDDERLFASSLSGVIGQADRRGIVQIVPNSEQEEGDTGDDGPAIEASFSAIGGIAFAGNGDLIVADRANDRLRKIEGFRPPGSTEKMVVSKNGSEVYIFNLQGRHLRTLDALTGDVLLYFDYNAQGHLIAVRDQFNNTTQIVRDSNSVPTQIVSPYGVITNVAVSNDELIRLTTPKGEIYRMSYLTGLLTSFENPKGGV
ncbi:MAG: hypothetical protein AABZ31_09905, partial [Bdellovibrionota bacterium]